MHRNMHTYPTPLAHLQAWKHTWGRVQSLRICMYVYVRVCYMRMRMRMCVCVCARARACVRTHKITSFVGEFTEQKQK